MLTLDQITRTALGARIRKARDDKDLALTPVAAAIGVTSDTLARYEAGLGEPSYRQVVILSELFERPLDWFAAGLNGKATP